MHIPQKTIPRLLMAITLLSYSALPGSSRVRADNAQGPAPENRPEQDPACNLEELKKQLEALKDREKSLNEGVQNLLKDRHRIKQLMEKYINGFRSELSPEDRAEFDKELRKYNKAVDAYDAALSNANSAISDGVDPAKAHKDADVQNKKDDMSKASDEMFKALEKEQKKQEAKDQQQVPENKVKEGVKKAKEAAKGEDGDDEAPPEPEAPKPPTKAQIMNSFKISVESLNAGFDKVQSQLSALGVKVKELAKEKAALLKKLREAEEKCLKPVSSAGPANKIDDAATAVALTSPGYHLEIKTDFGLISPVLTTQFGTLKVNLPGDARPGEQFSGSYWLEPAGKTDAEREKNGDQLDDHSFRLGGHKVTVSPKQYLQLISWGPNELSEGERLEFLNDSAWVGETVIPNVRPNGPIPTGYAIPTGAQHGSLFTIHGPFDGLFAKDDFVEIGGERVPMVAESERSRTVWDTSKFIGPSNIRIGENGRTYQCPFHNVSVKLSAPNLVLKKGETTVLTVVVSGLASLKQDVPFELINQSPAIVSMSEGNQQNTIIHSGSSGLIKADGTYTTTRTLTGITPGAFTITGTVRWRDTCKPPME